MTTPLDIPPFQVQPFFSNLYHAPDLLDLSAPGPSSPPSSSSSPQPPSTSIFSSATSIAAAAGRRAAAVASAAASPSSPHTAGFKTSLSPDRSGIDRRQGGGGGPEQRIEVRCVEGYGDNVYIGRSDGVVEWWTCDRAALGTGQHEGWTQRHRHTLFPRRPIQKIVILPKVSRIFVLSEGTLHPLTLPALETVPSTVIQPLRGVISVVLDDDELEWDGPGSEDRGGEMTVVIVRRKGLGIYRLGQRLIAQKEIPLPSPPTSHALASQYLCVALPHSSTYALIDLSDASLTEVLPVSQIDSSVLDFEPNPNIVVIPGENEFLVTSYTGVLTMGVFLTGQGDPVRGTIEWPEHPLAIAVESGYIIALLRNQMISVHSLNDLDKPIQAISLDQSFGAFTLSYSPYGISIRDTIRDQRMITSRMLLLSDKLVPSSQKQTQTPAKEKEEPEELTLDKIVASPPEVSPAGEEPPSGSGLTPPSSPPPFSRQPIAPTRSSSLLQKSAPSRSPFSTAIAETIIIGPNGVQSISPTPVVTKLEKFCAERRMEEATALVDEERRKGRRGEIDGDKATHQATLRLLHLYLACHLLLETTFEKAGDYFIRGKIDPRLLVRLFPVFRGKLIGSAEEVDVLEGVKGVMSEMPSIEEIISTSISRNYSPHVSPSTSRAPETLELANALNSEANTMLTDFLRKTRLSRRKGGGTRGVDSRKIDIVIDTTLAKLLADEGTTNELLALLAGPNDVVLSELEPFLGKRPYVLATVMRQQGRIDRVLELLREIAESEAGDPLCEDPVDEVAQQLDSVKDPIMFREYALWVVKRNPERGIAILLGQSPKTGVKLDDTTLVEDLRTIDTEAANRYLEYVVVAKRSPLRQLHEDLLERLLNLAEKEVQDDGVKYHLEELDAEYRLSSDSQPFVIFLADIAPLTPIKSLRLKLILFLQGSPFYDLAKASQRLESIPQLKTELAIVLGRQGLNRRALQLLAKDIGDFVSAQTFCTQGGEIVPPRVAHIVAGHVPELVSWATLGDVGRKRRGTVDGKVQEGLVKDLLGVYMQDGASTAKQAAALLNAQSVHLDILDVLDLMPGEWPLDVVSTFVQRALRRELHEEATSKILKSIAAGQNMQMAENYLDQITSMPPKIIANGPKGLTGSGDMQAPYEGSIAEKEDGPIDIGEKEQVVTGESDQKVEKEGQEQEGDHRGYFSPTLVAKELKDLGVEERPASRRVE